jgi:hypothetical protein
MRNFRLTFIILAMVFLSFGIVQLGRALQDFHRNYFWTPTTRQEPVEEGKETFEVYVRGKLLNSRLQAGELALKNGESWSPLQSDDVTVRLNHIQGVTRVPLLLGVGFLSAALAWLIALPGMRSGRESVGSQRKCRQTNFYLRRLSGI